MEIWYGLGLLVGCAVVIRLVSSFMENTPEERLKSARLSADVAYGNARAVVTYLGNDSHPSIYKDESVEITMWYRKPGDEYLHYWIAVHSDGVEVLEGFSWENDPDPDLYGPHVHRMKPGGWQEHLSKLQPRVDKVRRQREKDALAKRLGDLGG